jgi:hypothetical protein
MVFECNGNNIQSQQIKIEKNHFFKFKLNEEQSSNSYRKIFIRKDKASGNTTSEIRTLFIFKEREGDYTVRYRNIFVQKINGQKVKDEQIQTIIIPFAFQSKIHRIVSMFLASAE